MNHAAEEAAHYVKQVVSGAREPGDPRDFFYFLALNEACAFFGSKVVNPKRKTDHEGHAFSTYLSLAERLRDVRIPRRI